MSDDPSMPPNRENKTLRLALIVLGLIALVQLIAVAGAFIPRVREFNDGAMGRMAARQHGSRGLLGEGTAALPGEMGSEPLQPMNWPTEPRFDTPSRDAAATGLESAEAFRGLNGSTVLDVVAQAVTHRNRGDLDAALAKLKEAEALAPGNPEILWELAGTYEEQGQLDLAMTHWRMVYEMGRNAGPFYFMAEEKVLRGIPSPTATEVPSGASPVKREPGRLALTPEQLAALEREHSVLRGDAVFIIDEVSQGKKQTPSEVGESVDLHIKVGSRDLGDRLRVDRVRIQVYFYDLVDGEHVVLTSADVTSEWETAPANWQDGHTETLLVKYTPTQLDFLLEQEQVENRKYYGYIVRLYYDGVLQDVHASPDRLQALFPAPANLNEDGEGESETPDDPPADET